MTKTLEASGRAADYAELLLAIPVLREWVLGMRLAMRMKPEPSDYDKVKRHLALYVANKLLRWPGTNTWYDNECLYAMGALHEKWGSLRLVSQEGMESWQVGSRAHGSASLDPRLIPTHAPTSPPRPSCQPAALTAQRALAAHSRRAHAHRHPPLAQKKLNEVLRLSNSFANAGAIPKDVVRAGQAAKDAYLAKRKDDMPSSARWVFEQAMLQHHSYLADVHAARDFLRKEGRTIDSEQLATYWRRYMVCAKFRCRLRAKVLRGATRRAKEGVQKALAQVLEGDYYKNLMRVHREYYAPVKLTAEDLDEKERRRQTREQRRLRYEEVHQCFK